MPFRYFIKNAGLINAAGTEAIDFLNRMSTNDLRKFGADEFKKTVLTTDKGRIVDLINVLNTKEGVIILTSGDFQDKVISHLEKYIIMDDVSLKKSDRNYVMITVFTEDPAKTAKDLFETEINKGRVCLISNEDFLFTDEFRVMTLNILCSSENLLKYKSILKDIKEIDSAEYDYFRIESGIPEGKNELNENINPVECGLERYISFKKGCYIGQEVIARLDSQSKIPKQMVKLTPEGQVFCEDKIYDDQNSECGFISSVAELNNKFLSLGFIRSTNLDFERHYSTENKNGKIKLNILKIN
ncbi:MAG: hypothetical protein IPL16_04295 [Ignavibacteria bacterium]|nr:hypothetical protein [Ignavibacteria bacterium]